MKKIVPLFGFILVGVLSAGCTENAPTQSSEDHVFLADEVGFQASEKIVAAGKGKPTKCDTWPDCTDESSGGVEYDVTVESHSKLVITHDFVGDALESNLACTAPVADFHLSAQWFTHDCPPPQTPFNYTTKFGEGSPHLFAGNALININMKKMKFRVWLYDGRKGSDVYETGNQAFLGDDITLHNEVDVEGGFTLHMHRTLLMTGKKTVGSAGYVTFHDVVFSLKP